MPRAAPIISAAGTSPPEHFRPGGPHALVTGRCVFAFDRDKGRFRLESLHPGHDLAEVLDACKGKVGVNIELKYYGHDQQLEQRVVLETFCLHAELTL